MIACPLGYAIFFLERIILQLRDHNWLFFTAGNRVLLTESNLAVLLALFFSKLSTKNHFRLEREKKKLLELRNQMCVI